ncbi:MAG: polyprenyl synthetase family protein [Pseudomonadota bacterium]
MNQEFKKLLQHYNHRVDQQLLQQLPDKNSEPLELHQAMSYSTFNGGKRIRPFLVYASGTALGISADKLDSVAVAVELIHSYSLVHDDMPAMDDDELRRGQPTCHIAFSEATALLTGDALQTHAFTVLSQNQQLNAEQKIIQVQLLAHASGSLGMAGGQAIDLASVGKQLNLQQLQTMHLAKTGALIQSCTTMVAAINHLPTDKEYQALERYAKKIGLAFQIKDDILDIEGNTQTLGKPQGSDENQHKPTYPAILGMTQAKQMAEDNYQSAMDALELFDNRADALRQLARYIIERNK